MTDGPRRIVGLGQRAATDDGVGLAVLDRLRAMLATGDITGGGADGGAGSVELETLSDPTGLVEVVEGATRVVVVDAVVAGPALPDAPPGTVLALTLADLDAGALPVSSHAMSVPQALGLAGQLVPGFDPAEVRIVGVVIEAPTSLATGLSPRVAAAVDEAARTALAAATEH